MSLKRVVKFEAERDPGFARWISHTVGGERIRHCLQCGLCSASCPLSLYMDYTPRRLILLSREGFKEEVLRSYSIWLCTCCYACMVECPKGINITHLMYALKKKAIEENFYPSRFAIPVMAREFARMVGRSGRITESWLMVHVFLRLMTWRMLGMSKLGLRMLRTGRMPLMPEQVECQDEVATMLAAVKTAERELAL